MIGTLKELSDGAVAVTAPLDKITVGRNIRSVRDDARSDRLYRSIRAEGQQQPGIGYRSLDSDMIVLVAGFGRYEAIRRAGLGDMRLIVYPREPSPGELFRLQLIENGIREHLTPIDEARAYRALMDLEGWNQARLADELHVDEATISRAIRLLSLPEWLQETLQTKGHMKAGHARELTRLPADLLDGAVKEIFDRRLTAAQTTKLVNGLLRPKKIGRPKAKDKVVVKISGYEASFSPTRLSVKAGPAKGKAPRTREQMIEVVEQLLRRLRDEFCGSTGQGRATKNDATSAAP